MNEEPRIRPEIQALVDRGNVTADEVMELRCNSWEWEAIIPAMNDQAFMRRIANVLHNCTRSGARPFVTYDDALKGLLVPELLRRFRREIASAEGHQKKWWNYEQEYILPCFKWAKESGIDLAEEIVKNPGHNCVEILVKQLQARLVMAHELGASEHERGAEIAEHAKDLEERLEELKRELEQERAKCKRAVMVSDDFVATIDAVREALGQKETHYLVIADDVKAVVDAIEGCKGDDTPLFDYASAIKRALAVLRRIQKEPGSGS